MPEEDKHHTHIKTQWDFSAGNPIVASVIGNQADPLSLNKSEVPLQNQSNNGLICL